MLCGRDGCVLSHNKTFRQLANEYKDEYKLDKSGEVKEIMQIVQKQNLIGRCLIREATGSKHWIEVDNSCAIRKCHKALTSSRQDKAAPDNNVKRIQTPHPNDMLCGHDAFVLFCNKTFRQLVNERKDECELDVDIAAREIMQIVQTQNPPGRFLIREATGSTCWIEIYNNKARKKCCEALRNPHHQDEAGPDNNAKRIKTWHPNHVLCGRGLSHNKTFRQLVNGRMDEYN